MVCYQRVLALLCSDLCLMLWSLCVVMLPFEGKLTNVWKWWAHLSASVLQTTSKQQVLCSTRTATETANIQSTWAFWLSSCDPGHQTKCQRWFWPVWCDPGPPTPAPREPKKECRLPIAPKMSMTAANGYFFNVCHVYWVHKRLPL
jgi:hypothetical protein